VIVSVSVSPFGATLEIERKSLPPLSCTSFTRRAIAGSRGRSTMCQSAAVPVPDTS
jgi:hypothetical protein